MLVYATGLIEEDMSKAQVGISRYVVRKPLSNYSVYVFLPACLIDSWYEGNPCNMHLLHLGQKVKEGVMKAGLIGYQFNTIGVRYHL